MFSKLCTALFLLFTCLAPPALADLQEISAEGLDGLYTTTTVSDWDSIRAQLIDAYGGEVKEITFTELQNPNLKGASIAAMPGGVGEVFILSDEEAPAGLLSAMSEVFPDLAKKDISEYNQGLAVTMQKNGNSYTIDGTVFKASKKPKAQTGGNLTITFAEGRTVTFPEGSKVLLHNEQAQGSIKIENFALTVPNDKPTAQSFIRSQLDNAGLKYKQDDLEGTTRFQFETNDGPPSSIMLTSLDDPNEMSVSVMIITIDE